MTPEELREEFLLVWREFFKRQKERHATHLEPATWKEGRQVVGKPLRQQGVENQAVITGIGVLSPIGNDPETVTESLRTGRHGIVPITRFDASFFRTNLVGEVPLDPTLGLDDPDLAEFDDPYLRFGAVAARRALRDAGVQTDRRSPRSDIALVLGTCNGGLRSGEAEYSWKHGKSDAAFDERMNLQAQFYGFGKAMANALGIGGEAWVVTTACSSTTAALGLAQMLINRGYFKTVLVGGADVLCVANMAGFDALKATSTGPHGALLPALRDQHRRGGLLLGGGKHGAGAAAQGPLLGRLAGHATTADAYHPTSPDPRGGGRLPDPPRRAGRFRAAPRADRLHQRPRQRDRGQRPGRIQGDPEVHRRAPRTGGLDQVLLRALHGGHRHPRDHLPAAGDERRFHPAHAQLHRGPPGVHPGLRAERGAPGGLPGLHLGQLRLRREQRRRGGDPLGSPDAPAAATDRQGGDHRPRDGHRGRAGDGPPAGDVAGRTNLPGAGDPVPPPAAAPLPAGGAGGALPRSRGRPPPRLLLAQRHQPLCGVRGEAGPRRRAPARRPGQCRPRSA